LVALIIGSVLAKRARRRNKFEERVFTTVAFRLSLPEEVVVTTTSAKLNRESISWVGIEPGGE
jgi:hypothetical protein